MGKAADDELERIFGIRPGGIRRPTFQESYIGQQIEKLPTYDDYEWVPNGPHGGHFAPTNRKEPAMKGKLKLQQELEQIDALIPTLEERRDEIRKMLENSFPSPTSDRVSVRIRYKTSPGRVYEYLMIRIPGGSWYTTGIGQSKTFTGWQAVQKWLADKRIDSVEINELIVGDGYNND